MVDRSLIDREAARTRAQMQRAGREADRSTRTLSQGGGARRGPDLRLSFGGSRAPRSASHFHHNRKYSNRARAHRAPGSAVAKVRYDLRLDRPEHERTDLDYTYICAPPGTPEMALDPVSMALASESSLGKKATLRARIMSHETIALPAQLNDDQRRELARQVAHLYREKMGVPIYLAIHKPNKNDNWHIHLSHPLREVLDDEKGGFKLGQKIMFEQQAAVRREAGLQPTNHGELKSLRTQLAATIANSMETADLDRHMCERWRWGHLKLGDQVAKAEERGDLEFVTDNAGRDPTRHEGPNPSDWRAASQDPVRQTAKTHNQDTATDVPGPELMTRTLLSRVIDQASKARITDPEHLRMLARDHCLSIHWVRSKGGKDAAVTGLQIQMAGGPKISGKQAGASLNDLKRQFGWDAPPAYVRYPAKSGEAFDAYAQAVRRAGLNIDPGQPKDLLPNVLAAIEADSTARRLRAQAAATAAPLAARAAGAMAHEPPPIFQHVQEDEMQDSKKVGQAAGAVATVASVAKFTPAAPVAATVELGARATQAAALADQASGGRISATSPMAGIPGVGGSLKQKQQGQQQQHRPRPRCG